MRRFIPYVFSVCSLLVIMSYTLNAEAKTEHSDSYYAVMERFDRYNAQLDAGRKPRIIDTTIPKDITKEERDTLTSYKASIEQRLTPKMQPVTKTEQHAVAIIIAVFFTLSLVAIGITYRQKKRINTTLQREDG